MFIAWASFRNGKCLNVIHFTSITHTAHYTYIRVLQGAEVGVMWSNVVEETGEHGQTFVGNHLHRYIIQLCYGNHSDRKSPMCEPNP